MPLITCAVRMELARLLIDVCMFSIPVTVLNCANCPTKAVGSMGLVGSWFFSCATMSCRNSFCCSWPVLPVPFAPEALPAAAAWAAWV